MKKIVAASLVVGLAVLLGATTPSIAEQPATGGANAAKAPTEKETEQMIAEAKTLLADYQAKLAELEIPANLAGWVAANSGKKEDFDAAAKASLALRLYHSNPDTYRRIKRLMTIKDRLDPVDARAMRLAELAFESNQLPPEMLEKMVNLSTEIEQIFNTYRAEIDGRRVTNNDLLEMLRKETDSARREEIWKALKQVGGQLSAKLLELAKVRNEAARRLGYANFWDMKIRLQEHDPEQLLAIFAELDRLTAEPFAKMKRDMDGELARRFKVEPEAIMPWHYDNPYFQAAPPSDRVNLDEFYENKKKEDIVALAEKFYSDIGLPIDEIVARSDLYEREGKDQHAFCTDIDRTGDVRMLCNIKPTAEWMDTMLHESGHAVYSAHIDRSLPFNLRDAAHTLTTEGVAMLFGALGKNPTWLVGYAGADPARVKDLAEAIRQQRRREQLIFARWTLVMLHFEKALYENPDQDLNKLWWDDVQRYQLVQRPASRNEPDWAAKAHFTIAPVYYHNYMLGELFAAQLRHVLAQQAGHQGPATTLDFNGRKPFGEFLKTKVFRPGSLLPWPEFVRSVTGENLTSRYFAEEVR
jgi:peptidyl-dipeptidase A